MMLNIADIPVAATLSRREAGARRWDCVVIGSGPAGAVAARELARQDCKVLLVEKSQHPRYKVCGGCVSAATLELLGELGLGAMAAALPAAVTDRLQLCTPHSEVTAALPRGLAISRQTLDTALVMAAIECGAHYLDRTAAQLQVGSSHRRVRLRDTEGDQLLETRLVLAADGLAGSSLAHDSRFAVEVSTGSRIGLGALLANDGAEQAWPVEQSTIGMHYAPGGYLGLVRVEHDWLNVAAAFDPEYVRACGGPAGAVARHLATTGTPCPERLCQAEYSGTPALTRRRRRLAGEGVFVIGDCGGYVEPFTGEGMLWAVVSARLVVPLAVRGIRQWSNSLADEWELLYRRRVGRKQTACRLIAMLSRHATLSGAVARLMALQPAVARCAVRCVAGANAGSNLLPGRQPVRECR